MAPRQVASQDAPASLRRPGAFLLGALLFVGLTAPSLATGRPPDILLLTLDTTRADALGCYGAAGGSTPNFDRLAKDGVRFASAWSPAPLTLPAHASLFTGLDPAEHGLRDNGWGRLESAGPVLADVLRRAGYSTAGFPASQVLDRRFGLGRGFDTYDDSLTAERRGQYGYPERTAAHGVAAVLSWVTTAPPARPWFVWLHFYDPHAPYSAAGTTEKERYAGELSVVDAEVGRLLAAWPANRSRLVAVVADHGEAFGEHGEHGHGLFLYRPTLEVPMILVGPGVPRGEVVRPPVGTRRLAATLASLVGLPATLPGPTLPLLGAGEEPQAIFHESFFAASAYGWHPLAAVTHGATRVIAAPRGEVYDLASDPAEEKNLAAEKPPAARPLERLLHQRLERYPLDSKVGSPADPEVAAALRALGYFSGQSRRAGSLDPKDGALLLAELEAVERDLAAGSPHLALSRLRALVARSPESVPFLSRLAALERQAGQWAAALATLDRALAASPELDFLHLERGELLQELGQLPEAAAAYRLVLKLHPRSATAWLRLAEIELRAGRPAAEEALLAEALANGTRSALLRARLAEIALARGELEAADRHLEEATALLPEWASAWRMWAEVARRQGRAELAAEREKRAASG